MKVPAAAAWLFLARGALLVSAQANPAALFNSQQAQSGDGTYYSASAFPAGACSAEEWVAEAGWVGSQEGKLWPVAMNANQYGGSETCGMCVAATGTGAGAGGDPFPTGSIRYGIVVDKCPECQPGSIDWRAPNQLDGRWSVDWYPVQCPVSGNFRFSTEGSNKWYLKVQVTNARAPVARLSLNIGGGYEVLARTADNHFIWQGPGVLPDGPILFQVESVFGDVVTASATFNYAIANQAVTSSAQFALSGAYRQALDGANPLATAAGANSMTGGQAAPPPPPQEQPPAPEQPQQQQPPTPPPAQEQPPAPEQPQQQPPTPPPAQEQPPAPEQQPPPSPPAQEQPPAPEQQPQPQQGCASIWGQCAGKGFSGPNCCPADYVCSFSSEWYSQCIPGSAPAPASAACAGEWEQCGGKGFTGASCCEANHECSVIDEWYSHCAPAQTPQQGAGIDCAGEWEQCGGKGFAGATCCGANHECSFIDEWYSHCAPVQASPPPGPSIDAAISSACSSVWQQCGGKVWGGYACCTEGSECVFSNEWYSQCLPVEDKSGCSSLWSQCGGINHAGPTCCAKGSKCVEDSKWYSQCVPA